MVGGAVSIDCDGLIWVSLSIGLLRRVRPYYPQEERNKLPFTRSFHTIDELKRDALYANLLQLFADTHRD